MDGFIVIGVIFLLLGPVAFFLSLSARLRASHVAQKVTQDLERLRLQLGTLTDRLSALEKLSGIEATPHAASAPQEAGVEPEASSAAKAEHAAEVGPAGLRTASPVPLVGLAGAPPSVPDTAPTAVMARSAEASTDAPATAASAIEPAAVLAKAAPVEAAAPEAREIAAPGSTLAEAVPGSAEAAPPPVAAPALSLEERLGVNWSVWVGGIALALGLVLLVRASIERGFFGPGARLVLGGITALGLVLAGEFLRRRERAGATAAGPFAAPYIPGVLTAAGTIGAFATIYAAHAVYGFIGPTISFLGLGLVGLVAMATAALHGPALAGLGLVGALATPLLVVSQSINPWPVVLYDLVVIACAYALARLKGWLWLALAAAGGGVLWGLAFDAGMAGGHPFLLASLVHVAIQTGLAAYALAILPHRRREDSEARFDPVAHGVLAVFAALAISTLAIGARGFFGPEWIAGALIVAALLFATGLRSAPAAGACGLGAIVALAALWLWPGTADWARFGMEVLLERLAPVEPRWFIAFGVVASIVGALAAGRRLLDGAALGLPLAALYAGTATLLPLAGLAIAYLRFSAHQPSAPLAAAAAVVAVGFMAATRRFMEAHDDELGQALKLGFGAFASAAIAAVALALVFGLDGGMLTVALALAALGTANVAVRYDIRPLRWCIVALGILVAARLAYEPRIVGSGLGTRPIFNWLLFGYGVPAVAFGLAGRKLRQQGKDMSSRIADALGVLFSALLFFFEIRHAMNGGDPFARGSSLVEQGLFATTAFGFAFVLSRLDGSRPNIVFRFASLAAGAIGMLGAALALGVLYNPLLEGASVEGSPLLNALLLAYLIPGLMAGALAIAARRNRPLWYWGGAAWLGLALTLGYFILETRRLFHGAAIAVWYGAGIAELGIDVAFCLTAATLCATRIAAGRAPATTPGPFDGFLRLAALATAIAAAIVAVLGLGLYANPLRVASPVGGGRILNALIIGYLLPAAAAALLARRCRDIGAPRLRLGAMLGAGLLLLAYLVLQLRVLFHGQIIEASLGAGVAELGCQTSLFLIGAILLAGRGAATRENLAPALSACLFVAAAVIAVLGLALFANPLLSDEAISRPLFNALAVGYALPFALCVVLARRARAAGFSAMAVPASIGAIAFLFAYASLELRRLFQGPSLGLLEGFTQGEVYAYSAAWCGLGVLLLAYGVWRGSREARLASACFVVAAALKVFLFDLAGLEGILRALSFIGLGVVLIGIGLVYQKLVFAKPESGKPA